MRKMIVVLGLTLALVSLFGLTAAVTASPSATSDHLKIDVCHKDGSSGNYSLVNVNINSVEDAQNVGGHGNHEGDSWESYTYQDVSYPGQGDFPGPCAEPPPFEPPDPEYRTVEINNCEGVTLQDQVREWEGGEDGGYGDWQNIGDPIFHGWTEPFVLETWEGFAEPQECLQTPPPDEADISIEVGACTYRDGQSYTLVSFTIFGEGVFTINGNGYDESGEIQLTPGSYPWSFEASEGYSGDDSGTLEIGSCAPGEPTPTPKPRHHPPTGPEDSVSIFGWMITMGIGLASAGIAGMRRR